MPKGLINIATYPGGIALLAFVNRQYQVTVQNSDGRQVAQREFNTVRAAKAWRESNGRLLVASSK